LNAEFDMLIVGAGIHGAGLAQAAAAHGYRVMVLEQQAIAAGTSSRSSKLIHGALRYLEQFDLGLVRECLRERELLLKLAPSLVKLTPFNIPVYTHTRRQPWEVRAGLSLYALLGGLKAHARFSAVSRKHWDSLQGLSQAGLQAVFKYWDAQTDDAALTRAVMVSAQKLGARMHMPARFEHATIHSDACEVTFNEHGTSRTVLARVLVNAAGPWVDKVAALITPKMPRPDIELIQGAHIILDTRIVKSIFYVEAPQDGRAVFIMPWHEHTTLVGTTETPFTGVEPAQVSPLPQEQEYLMAVVYHYFPHAQTSILSSFAGIRVLPTRKAGAFQRSREIVFVTDRPRFPRVLGIYGGKLTSYRADAQQALIHIIDSLPKCRPIADTRSLTLEQ